MNLSLHNLKTNRLTFRKVEQKDAEIWINLFNSPKVAEHLGLNADLTPQEINKIWFQKVFHRYENDLGFMNAVLLKETGQLIGQAGLLIQEIEGEQKVEISYSILPEFAGQGFALESAQACKEFAVENKITDELISVINCDNYASEKVAIRNGMKLKKTIKKYKGGYDVNIYHLMID